jgi:hypothetical protein
VSAVEQLAATPAFRDTVAKVTSQIGNHHLAFSIINGDSAAFEQGRAVTIHLGLFDTHNLTWKWITKVEDTKGRLSKWEVTSSSMISNSFAAARNLRGPASEK